MWQNCRTIRKKMDRIVLYAMIHNSKNKEIPIFQGFAVLGIKSSIRKTCVSRSGVCNWLILSELFRNTGAIRKATPGGLF